MKKFIVCILILGSLYSHSQTHSQKKYFLSGDTLFEGTPILTKVPKDLTVEQKRTLDEENYIEVTNMITVTTSFPEALLLMEKQERLRVISMVPNPLGINATTVDEKFSFVEYTFNWASVVLFVLLLPLVFSFWVLLTKEYYIKGRSSMPMLVYICSPFVIWVLYAYRNENPTAYICIIGLLVVVLLSFWIQIKHRRRKNVQMPQMV